jgi:hypothetical protein
VKKIFKRNATSGKFDPFIQKYNIPKEYLFINRKMVTRALLIGIAIGLIPMPFQMLLVVGMIFFVKFNVPIALLMVWLSLALNGLKRILHVFSSLCMLERCSICSPLLPWFTPLSIGFGYAQFEKSGV